MSDQTIKRLEDFEQNMRAGAPRRRGTAIEAVAAIGAPPLGERDGLIDPLQWEGRDIASREWIVRNWVPCGCVTMLTGNGGEGKSRVSLQLLIAAATGTTWMGMPTNKVRALGIYCEDEGDELHRRTADILKAGVVQYSDLETLALVSRKGMDNTLYEAQWNDMTGHTTMFYERLKNTAIDFGAQIIVLDSLYNFFGGNEISRPQATQFIGALDALAMEIGGAVVIVAHPSVAGITSGSGSAGSTAWHNAVRSRLYLHRRPVDKATLAVNPEAKGKLILEPMKGNYGPPQKAIELEFDHGQFVPADQVGLNNSAVAGAAARDLFDLENRGE